MTAPDQARRWWILAVIGIAQVMVILDNSIVNIALPSAQADLGFTIAERQWVATSYALAFGSLLLLGGRVADLFGRKRVFLVGLIGFAVASIFGGLAPSFGLLVGARALQGAFGALLAPAALSLLTTFFPGGRDRVRAFGVFSVLSSSGSAVGLLLGGALTQYVDWRWCMYVNAVFAAVAFVFGSILLPALPSGRRPRLDFSGTLFASAGLFCLVFGFARAEDDGWASSAVTSFLVTGVVLLAGFVLLQRKVTAPLLPLRVVLDRHRGGAFLSILVLATGVFSISLFVPYILQREYGFSPLITGVAFLPLAGGIALAANTVPLLLLPRLGPRTLIAAGLLLEAGGLFWFSFLDAGSDYIANVIGPLILVGVGQGTANSTATNTATLGVHPGDAGVASATVNTMLQIGASVGTALLSSVAGAASAGFAGTPTAAALHGYATAFAVASVIFVGAAVVVGALVPGRRKTSRASGTVSPTPGGHAAGPTGTETPVPGTTGNR